MPTVSSDGLMLAAVTAFFVGAGSAGFALGLLFRWDRLDDPTPRAPKRAPGALIRQLRQWGDELAADLLDEVGDETTGDAA